MAGPQYFVLDRPQSIYGKNWWERPSQQTGSFLYQLVLAKAAHNMRMDEQDRELEARKQNLKYAAEQDKLKAKSAAQIQGVDVSAEPTEAPGETYDEYLQGYITRQEPHVYSYAGKNWIVDSRGQMHPVSDTKDVNPNLKTYSSPRAASRATIGSLMLASAVNLRQSQYAGENWYELRVGTDDQGKPRYLDTRAFAPFSTYLFVAEHFVHPERIKPSDYAQAVIGLNRIAGTGLVAVDWLRAKTNETMQKQFTNFAGQYLASFLTPARTFSDIYGAVDKEENIYRDYRQSPMVLPTMMNLPYISQMAPESPSPLKTDRSVKAEPVGGVPGGLLRQVTGISVKTKNQVEREIDRIGLDYSTVAPRTGDPEGNRIMARYMAPMAEAAVPKLLSSNGYQDQPAEMKRLAMGALFTQIKKNAFIKMSVTHPYVAMRIKYERLNDDVQKMVESRQPGIRGMLTGQGAD